MNYRLRSSEPAKRRLKGPLIALALLAAALIAVRVFAPGFASKTLLSVFAPVWKGGNAALDAGMAAEGLAKSKRSLIEENASLRRELEAARLELSAARVLEAENAELRAALGVAGAEKGTVAAVLAKPPVSPYDTIILEVPAGAAIAAGSPIYANEWVLLGEVAEVHGSRIVGRLYSTAGVETNAVIERTQSPHKAVGVGGGNFELRVPREVDVSVGDRLMSPGLSQKLLGEVRQIESGQSDSFKLALVRSPVNIFQLKWVIIGSRPLR